MNTQKQIFLIVVLFFTFVAGCAAYATIDLPIRAERQTDFFKSESVERGALLFANNCRTCHGIKGQGGVGLPLNKPEFQDQDPLILKSNQDLLRRTLYCGRAGTLMPAWLNTNGGSLNERQIDHIIDLITSPISEKVLDEEGQPTSEGWVQAVEFAHNLNAASAAVVGGDSLDSIAKDHQIGNAEMVQANPGLTLDQILEDGATIRLPANGAFPSGKTYKVVKSNETLVKVAQDHHVGAAILADLNKLPYRIDSKNNFTLLGSDGAAVPGMFPGATVVLPEGAVYVVRSGDTVDSIATKHGIAASAIVSANQATLSGVKTSDPLGFERKLVLPANTGVVVQPGDTLATLATEHGMKPEDLAKENGLGADAVLTAGAQLKLPADTKYTVQSKDTLADVAAHHGIAVDALAKANNLAPTDPISSDVVLKLPKVDKFVVAGQSLDDIAKTYSNVTADSLGKANGVKGNDILRIGQQLKLPPDTWGAAPPDAKNPGTACVQHAVPNSVFNQLPGVGTGTPSTAPTAPAETSTTVLITANSNDWTVTADGKAQAPNKGTVLIKKGTSVDFDNKAGLHTITDNGTKLKATFNVGETFKQTFNDAGTFKITCDFHPDMLAYIFVQ